MIRPWAVSTRNIFPGSSRPFLRTRSGGDVEDARLGRHDDQVVLRDDVPGRPQAVAVERRADDRPVREGHGRRTVPRLHELGVVLVEVPPSCSMKSCRAQASGISIIMAWAMGRPAMTRSSRALSNEAESLPARLDDGKIFLRSSPNRGRPSSPRAPASS